MVGFVIRSHLFVNDFYTWLEIKNLVSLHYSEQIKFKIINFKKDYYTPLLYNGIQGEIGLYDVKDV